MYNYDYCLKSFDFETWVLFGKVDGLLHAVVAQ